MSDLPCMREKCIGKDCANFGERGCKGGEHPPWSWSKWYLEELPKIKERKERTMNANEYQKAAYKFASFGGNETYAYAGLAEEAGEVLGKFAKFIRKHDGIEPSNAAKWTTLQADLENYRKELKKELGDVLWMVAAIATLNNFDMSAIMQENIAKLTDRLNRGVICGDGDNR